MVLGGRDLAPRRRPREGRGRRGALLALVVVVLAAGGVGAYLLLRGSSPSHRVALPPCPPQRLAAAAPDGLPQPRQIRVKVLNSTVRPGLAAGAAHELQARGFAIGGVGNAKLPAILHATAEVRYSGAASAKAMATVVAEEVPDARLVADSGLTVPVVLILGDKYAGLASPQEVAAARQRDVLALTGTAPPSASPAACDSSSPSPSPSAAGSLKPSR